ncbi:hypothetical protein F5144DRAFT_562669 [Chaetomium tenue]|uniref:Uncharacterized protein n=1 Tax=Chaetomium tenue TaxID=1854479 RepID=A0ACB7PHR1_9PEZI|nr:hypothetical protein F5144DRAFT_562669 [Chaetomium globosum]
MYNSSLSWAIVSLARPRSLTPGPKCDQKHTVSSPRLVTQFIEIDPPRRPQQAISINFRLPGPTCLVEDAAPQKCMRQGRDGKSCQKMLLERHCPPIAVDPAGPDRDAQCARLAGGGVALLRLINGSLRRTGRFWGTLHWLRETRNPTRLKNPSPETGGLGMGRCLPYDRPIRPFDQAGGGHGQEKWPSFFPNRFQTRVYAEDIPKFTHHS